MLRPRRLWLTPKSTPTSTSTSAPCTATLAPESPALNTYAVERDVVIAAASTTLKRLADADSEIGALRAELSAKKSLIDKLVERLEDEFEARLTERNAMCAAGCGCHPYEADGQLMKLACGHYMCMSAVMRTFLNVLPTMDTEMVQLSAVCPLRCGTSVVNVDMATVLRRPVEVDVTGMSLHHRGTASKECATLFITHELVASQHGCVRALVSMATEMVTGTPLVPEAPVSP